jgi:pyruvate dehydrogenase E2 component (dihydrolipoamide acetyltransferase)
MKEVIMPKFGFTQEDAQIVRWLKREGDAVEQGEPILEVTTDKVNMEVEAPEAGVLAGVQFNEGDTVPVTRVIAFIAKEGETAPASTQPMNAATTSALEATPVALRLAKDRSVNLADVRGTGANGRITREDVEAFLAHPPSSPTSLPLGEEKWAEGKVRATPNARRLAEEQIVSLEAINGSGPRGRVQGDDVLQQAQAQLTSQETQQAASASTAKTIPYAGVRKTIGARLQQSYQQAPHITFDIDVDATQAEALRARANVQLARLQSQTKVSLTAVLVKAVAWALKRHPLMNSRLDLDAGHIVLLDEVNIGVAVALNDGLIVPAVRGADHLGITQIAEAITEFTTRARTNKLRLKDLGQSTFTISNLGMFGVDRFNAIINPPESAILAVGRVAKRFIPDENDQPIMRPIMTLTLSADHRVIDGAVAARFLGDLRDAIEQPDIILL